MSVRERTRERTRESKREGADRGRALAPDQGGHLGADCGEISPEAHLGADTARRCAGAGVLGSFPQERILERMHDQIVDVPVPHVALQEHISKRIHEQTVDQPGDQAR